MTLFNRLLCGYDRYHRFSWMIQVLHAAWLNTSLLCIDYSHIIKLEKENKLSARPLRDFRHVEPGFRGCCGLPGAFRWNSHPSDARLVARGGDAGTCGSCGCQLPVLVGLCASPPVGMEPGVGEESIGEVGVLSLSPEVATHPPEARRRSGRVCVGPGVTCFHLLPSWRNPPWAHAQQN